METKKSPQEPPPPDSAQATISLLLTMIEDKLRPLAPPSKPSRRARALAILRTKTEELAALAQFYGIE